LDVVHLSTSVFGVSLRNTVSGLNVDSVFLDVATTVITLEPINSNSTVGDFGGDAARLGGFVASRSLDIEANRRG
jgi:hypothetical protein